MMSLKIQKRNGDDASFNPQKIYLRIKRSAKGLNVNSDEIFIKVITSVPTEGNITTKELDKLVYEIAASYTGSHHDYSRLASSVAISSYHKETSDSFSETMRMLNNSGVVNDALIKIIDKYGDKNIDDVIKHENDYNFDYFAWRSLQEMYLLKTPEGKVVERPQHMYMRVALWVTRTFEEAVEYYNSLSNQLISPATPIMINSGTKTPQLASCVLHYNNSDSRDGLLGTLNDISTYSSDAAGIGLCMSNIRSKESRISSSGGYAGGLLKYLKIVNESLRYFNQQGRRPGSAAIYIEPWHKDIIDLLEIKKNTGAEELRARDLFTALWIPDNFMRAVETNGDWYLFCPNDILKAGVKPLQECYGQEYEDNYNKAVALGLGKKVSAQTIWSKIVESQIETGVPYLSSKDNANNKTNHQNIGVVKQSNLCNEIYQYTDEDTTAICTLSSMVLKNFIKDGKFDLRLLHDETRKVVRALNKVVDINNYSTEQGRKGGMEQRAIAIGTQGLADVFYLLDYIFTSEEARQLNKDIFETIYYAAISESNELCRTGQYQPYKFFEGSPMSQGVFQFDMWGLKEEELSGFWDWNGLKDDVAKWGVCNSLFTAQMPVASSAKITGSYEMTEPAHSAIFNRRVVGGEIMIVNKYLISDFEKIGIWCEELKNEIILNEGSIQNINFNNYLDPEEKSYNKKVKRIEHLIPKYKTIWEISQRELIDMAADRGPFIDQSQSMNIYMGNPTLSKITSSHFHSWRKGLKTLCYYVRTKAISTGAKHLAVDISKIQKPKVATPETPKVDYSNMNLPPKPENSEFECFGCSS
jgi:ribonucleoside-diphosphate reductase alpha chain